MLKRIANAIRSTNDENEEENNLITSIDKINIEIMTLKGNCDIKCNFEGYFCINTTMNNKPQEIIETKHIKPEEKCYFENNNWWIFTGKLKKILKFIIQTIIIIYYNCA